VAKTLPQERFSFGNTVTKIDGKNKTVHLADGSSVTYRSLISTMPLDEITEIIPDAENLRPVARELIYSSTHVVGVGIRGVLPPRIGDKCWLYLLVPSVPFNATRYPLFCANSPEPDSPFYRATVFSNYSPYNCPQPDVKLRTIQTADPSQSGSVDTKTERAGPCSSCFPSLKNLY
jgi:hypothetical protein